MLYNGNMKQVHGLSNRAAAKLLGVSHTWVAFLIRRGELRPKTYSIKIDLLPKSEIARYIRRHKAV